MNELRESVGWYADPAGTYELRYFDGQWTDQVATGGVVSRHQLASAAPVAAPVDVPVAARRVRNRTKRAAVIAGVAAAGVTVAVVLALRPSHGGSSFCADYAALGNATTNARLGEASSTDVNRIVGLLHKLAGEAPTAAKADLTLLANDMSTLAHTGSGPLDDDATQGLADRIDAVAQRQCNG